MHRVVNPPGAQADCVRSSLVYFARPEDEVKLKALKGSEVIGEGNGEEEEDISSKDWILKQAFERRIVVPQKEDERIKEQAKETGDIGGVWKDPFGQKRVLY
jgi:hypothetical protein